MSLGKWREFHAVAFVECRRAYCACNVVRLFVFGHAMVFPNMSGSSVTAARGSLAASAKSELGRALSACRSAFIAFGLFSAVLNLLALTGSLFMLEVYDRVIPSRSVPTLVGLLSLVVVLYLFQGLLDAI